MIVLNLAAFMTFPRDVVRLPRPTMPSVSPPAQAPSSS
jgi:hypothetical protein